MLCRVLEKVALSALRRWGLEAQIFKFAQMPHFFKTRVVRSPIYVTILSGNNLFNTFSKNGIVQIKIRTAKTLNIM